MGYHSNEEQIARLRQSAVNLANDRARLENGLRMCLAAKGVEDDRIDALVTDVRAAKFETLLEALTSFR